MVVLAGVCVVVVLEAGCSVVVVVEAGCCVVVVLVAGVAAVGATVVWEQADRAARARLARQGRISFFM